MSIREPKFLYLNFTDHNNSIVEREANFPSQSRTAPILERCSDYVVSLVGFNIPTNNFEGLLKIEFRTTTIPIVPTLENGNNQKQNRVLLTYYPDKNDVDQSRLEYRNENFIYNSMVSNEQLRETDLQILWIGSDGTEYPQKLDEGQTASVQLQFTRVGQVFSEF